MFQRAGSVLETVRRHRMRMSILAIMLSAGLFGMLFILDRTKEQWDRAGVLHAPRPLIVSRLRHHLGYGGVVHNFLNSILRPDAERQEDTAIDLGAVRGTLLYYDSLDVSPMERSSRIIIAEELDRIYVAARRIESGEFKGRAPEDVFRSLDVDLDALAAAVDTLAKISAGTSTASSGYHGLLSDFEAAIGLNGMIQNLKLFLLTGDTQLLDDAETCLDRALTILGALRQHATSVAEAEALFVIHDTISTYRHAIRVAGDMTRDGASAAEIDAVIRINDVPAISAYATLLGFEKLRLMESTATVASGFKQLEWTMIGLVLFVLLPMITEFGSFCLSLITGLPDWERKLSDAASDLAHEELHKVHDFSSLPSEFANLETPFGLIRNTIWHRRETALQDQVQVAAVISENERFHSELEALRIEQDMTRERARTAHQRAVEAVNDGKTLSSVMDSLSHGILASRGIGEIVFWNSGVPELIGVSPEWLSGGRTLRDLIIYLASRGEYGQGDPVVIADAALDRLEERLGAGVVSSDHKFANGRVLALEMSKSTSGLIVFSAADVTEHHEQVEAMQQQATSDPLTGLPNRVALDEFTTAMLKHSERSGEVAAIMAIDLDGFKPINDTHGHHAGDELLREIATRMQEEARETDFVARVGGDEFIIVLLHLEDGNGALRFGQRLLRAIEMPVTLEDGTEVHVSASAGISLFPYHGREAQPLCVLADMALYEAKGKGRNAVVMYELPETQAVNVLTAASSAS